MNAKLALWTLAAMLIATSSSPVVAGPNTSVKLKPTITQSTLKNGRGIPQPNAIPCDGSDESVGCLDPEDHPPENWARSMPFDFIGFGAASVNVELERVEVYGQRVCTLTINGVSANLPYCDIQLLAPNEIPLVDQMTGTSKASLKDQIIGWLFSPPPIPAPGCSPLVHASAKAVTSRDDYEYRRLAAGQIILATQGMNNTNINNKDFIVYYSDGGSEVWTYVAAAPAAPKNPKDRKLGDGVPKC